MKHLTLYFITGYSFRLALKEFYIFYCHPLNYFVRDWHMIKILSGEKRGTKPEATQLH